MQLMTKEEIKKELQSMFDYHYDEFGLTRDEALEVVMYNIVQLYYDGIYTLRDTVDMLKEIDYTVDDKALEKEKERRDYKKAQREARKKKIDGEISKFKPVEKYYRDCTFDKIVVLKEGFNSEGLSDSEIIRSLKINEPLKRKDAIYVTSDVSVFNNTCVAVQYGLDPNVVRLVFIYMKESFKDDSYEYEAKETEVESVRFSQENEMRPLEVSIIIKTSNGGRQTIKKDFPINTYCLLLPRFVHSFNSLRPWKQLNKNVEEQLFQYLDSLEGESIPW